MICDLFYYYYVLNPITIFEFGLKHAKGYPSLEYSFICFHFFKHLCLFVVKVDNITKIDKDSTICSIFFLFSPVPMVVKRPVFPENNHFNLRGYNSSSICQNFEAICPWNYHCLMQKLSHFFWNHYLNLFVVPKSFLRSKNTWKIVLQTVLGHYHWTKYNILKIWGTALLPLFFSLKHIFSL